MCYNYIGECMKVIISAGGTGGHIYPALAILNKIKEHDSNAEFLYIGTTDRMESKIVPERGINYYGIKMIGLHKNLTAFKSIYLFLKSIKLCKNKIKEFKPDVVIGVGGYVTTPVILAAHRLHIKTIIHEQNSIPGKSNRLLTKYVNKVLVSLPGSIKYFDKNKTVYTGNPRSSEVYNMKPISKGELGFEENKKLVLIVMGSLGSMTINNELLKIIPKFKDCKYNVLIVTGKDYISLFDFDYKNVKIVPYLENMGNVLKSVDVIVTRAGASTLAEILGLGIPSILVPSPYVANNHQYYNAMEIVNNKAGLLLEEKDFNADNLKEKIDLLLEDNNLYNECHNNAFNMGIRDSSDKIYEEIIKILR